MLILDVTPLQADGAAAIVFTDTKPRTRQSGTLKARQIGVCKAVPNSAPLPPVGERGDYMMSPSAAVKNYFLMYENRAITGPLKVAVIHGPKHGELADEGADELDHTFSYRPKPGYIGEDRATLLVEIGGYSVRVSYFFQAVDRALGNNWEDELCGDQGYIWKISRAVGPSKHPNRG